MIPDADGFTHRTTSMLTIRQSAYIWESCDDNQSYAEGDRGLICHTSRVQENSMSNAFNPSELLMGTTVAGLLSSLNPQLPHFQEVMKAQCEMKQAATKYQGMRQAPSNGRFENTETG